MSTVSFGSSLERIPETVQQMLLRVPAQAHADLVLNWPLVTRLLIHDPELLAK